MKWKGIACALGLTLSSGTIWAQAPCPAPCPIPGVPSTTAPRSSTGEAPRATPEAGARPDMAAPSMPSPSTDPAAPPSSSFAQAPETGTAGGGSYSPTMFGDLSAAQISGPLTVTINGVTTTLTRGRPIPPNLFVPGAIFNFDIFNTATGAISIRAGTPVPPGSLVPTDPLPGRPSAFSSAIGVGILSLVGRGAFRIAENESVKPIDRVFFNYNYFNNLAGSLNPPGASQTDLHRELIGFEKTFLDGDASFGMRLPYLQVTGDSDVEKTDIGDLTMILKYAFINDRDTGNCLSGGLVLTVPTGANFLPAGLPDIHPVLLQPFGGVLVNMGDFYVHGFTSIVIPTDERDVTILFNDLGVGYYLYRSDCPDNLVSMVTPTLEGHLTTPLNHRGAVAGALGGIDIFDMTMGATVGLGKHSFLNTAVVVPLTGPKPFDFEGLVQFNYRF